MNRQQRRRIPGDPAFAAALLDGCYGAGFELAFSDELDLDHGTMLPLHFLLPGGEIPVVPVIINTPSRGARRLCAKHSPARSRASPASPANLIAI